MTHTALIQIIEAQILTVQCQSLAQPLVEYSWLKSQGQDSLKVWVTVVTAWVHEVWPHNWGLGKEHMPSQGHAYK